MLHQQAADLAATFERAYTTLVDEWGYPPPLDDGDGKIDVDIGNLTLWGSAAGLAFTETAADESSGYIYVEDDALGLLSMAMHELFHLVQYASGPRSTVAAGGDGRVGRLPLPGLPADGRPRVDQPTPLADTRGAPDMSLAAPAPPVASRTTSAAATRAGILRVSGGRFGGGIVEDIFLKAQASTTRAWMGSRPSPRDAGR